jgi:hypothetical protein
VLQNDIGTTDAHVLVVHVEGLRAQLTYTDVHMQRLLFFQSLFEGWRSAGRTPARAPTMPMEDGVYHLCIGTFTARKAKELEDYLAFLGSRLVFLIDWNRARKRLRQLLPKKDALALLKWAGRPQPRPHGLPARRRRADGVRGAGLRRAGAAAAGRRLDSVLGREQAAASCASFSVPARRACSPPSRRSSSRTRSGPS